MRGQTQTPYCPFLICHCEKPIEKQSSKRCGFLIVHARVPRGNPPKGFRSSFTICGKQLSLPWYYFTLSFSFVTVGVSPPTTPLPRPPTPHGQRRTLFILAIENCFVADIYLTLLNGSTLIDKSPLLWKIMLQVFVLQFTITPFSEIKVIA